MKGIDNEYKSLDEIKPKLVNETDKPIYLLPEDCGRAYLSLYYMNKTWRQSLSISCYGEVIEIKPGKNYEIPALVWRPLKTRDGKLIEKKDFPGKYRMTIRYSLTDPNIKPEPDPPRMKVRNNPDTNQHPPETSVREISAEFVIAP